MRHLFYLTTCLFFSLSLSAQNCPTTVAGTLSGGYSTIVFNDTLPMPMYATAPSGLPNTEFLILLEDSMATDGLGAPILWSSLDGRVVPNDFALGLCNTVCVLPFSYDLADLQLLVDSLLLGDYFPGTACCTAINNFATGLCDSIQAQGITQGSDLQNLNDVITLFSAFTGTDDAPSVTGMLNAVSTINSFLNLAGNCSGGVMEICYAVNLTDTAAACYHVTSPNAFTNLTFQNSGVPADTFLAIPTDTIPLGLYTTTAPMSATDSVYWYLGDTSSNYRVTADGRLYMRYYMEDTIAVVAQTVNGCLRDTMWVVVTLPVGVQRPEASAFRVNVAPLPFGTSLEWSTTLTEASTLRVRLLSTTGQVLIERTHVLASGRHRLALPTADLAPGAYVLQVVDAAGRVYGQVVVK